MSLPTFLGLLAIFCFSSGIAFSRSLSETIGTVQANSIALIAGGIFAYGYESLRVKKILVFSDYNARYLWAGGFLFIASQVPFWLAIGLANTREQTIVVGLINYLWCGLSMVLSVPILSKKSRWCLIPGCVVAFTGVILASVSTHDELSENLKGQILPYILAGIGAISWSLYSNLCRKWCREIIYSGVPFFLLASGIVLAHCGLFIQNDAAWSIQIIPELLYMALVPVFFAYIFWDIGIRKGNHTLILTLSYFIPVLSTGLSCVYLNVMPPPTVWLGVFLVFVGAMICKYSIVENSASKEPHGRYAHGC